MTVTEPTVSLGIYGEQKVHSFLSYICAQSDTCTNLRLDLPFHAMYPQYVPLTVGATYRDTAEMWP